jgi:hypothetical protein
MGIQAKNRRGRYSGSWPLYAELAVLYAHGPTKFKNSTMTDR